MASFPVKKPYRITQGFKPSHLGIDVAPQIPGQTGVKIYAPEKSTVVGSGSNPGLEGQYLVLKGSKHWYYFGHFAKRSVSMNQNLREGQVLGIMGKTGLATNIHTHHEVRTTRSGGQIDPEAYYKKVTKRTLSQLKDERIKKQAEKIKERDKKIGLLTRALQLARNALNKLRGK